MLLFRNVEVGREQIVGVYRLTTVVGHYLDSLPLKQVERIGRKVRVKHHLRRSDAPVNALMVRTVGSLKDGHYLLLVVVSVPGMLHALQIGQGVPLGSGDFDLFQFIGNIGF